jgi:hypothetical protein
MIAFNLGKGKKQTKISESKRKERTKRSNC